MQDKIQAFKDHVTQLSSRPEFMHHIWFVPWHLEVVERMALELAGHYPQADRDLVQVMAWLHDYAKILDFDNQHEREPLDKGREQLLTIGFDQDFANKAADYIAWLDQKMEVDLHEAPIEVQIVSTADGCSHMVGPFMHIFWHEATDKNFAGRTYQELMAGNIRKAEKDWTRKIILPEARKAFEPRYNYLRELSGELPDKFFS